MENEYIDKLGICPNCKTSWDGGDVFEVLSNMDIHSNKSSHDIQKLSATYGWSENTKTRFSNTTSIIVTSENKDISKGNFIQCKKCLHVYNINSGKEYSSIHEAKIDIQGDEKDIIE